MIEQQISSGSSDQHVGYFRFAKEPVDQFQEAENE
jgi:hypothetical protein